MKICKKSIIILSYLRVFIIFQQIFKGKSIHSRTNKNYSLSQRMSSSQQQSSNLINFKSTNTTHDLLELQFQQNKTVQEYKEQIGQLLDYDPLNIKFVFKGKVLVDKEKAGCAGLKGSTVMMVLSKPKKVQKPTLASQQQVIPKTNLTTGLGSSSPVGFGGYGIMNHPGYMSAISSAVDPQKMQEMLNDPHTQAMIQQMLDDPQTIKNLLQQDPMAKQLMDQNPTMKLIMSNPTMMKMLLNKDTIKMAREMQKTGNVSPQNMQNLSNSLGGLGGFSSMGGMGGMVGLDGMGGFGNNNSTSSNAPNTNPFANMFGNPIFPMMGSGFGNNQNGLNFPNNQQNPFSFSNPLLSNNGLNRQSSNSSSLIPQNNMISLFQNIQNSQQEAADEIKYSTQIKELNSMGFSDKDKCIKFLKQTDGDIDQALQKMCLDEDQKESNKQKKQ